MHAAAPTRDHAASTPNAASSGAPAAADCDLLVVGSGAGGLAAAVTAATLGLKVIVVEKDTVYGGTTAWSGGWMWIPRNPLAQAAGIREDVEAPRTYLRHELGAQYDPARVDAFLQNGPRMVEFFRSRTALQFIDGNLIPDFHGGSPGACGRRRGDGRARPRDRDSRTARRGAGLRQFSTRRRVAPRAVRRAPGPGAPVDAWLICDHRFIRRYGLGHVRPAPLPLGPALHSGYLQRGSTPAALTRACCAASPTSRA